LNLVNIYYLKIDKEVIIDKNIDNKLRNDEKSITEFSLSYNDKNFKILIK